ncbi:MAG TPA: glycosyltransferase family 39 protein, partial [Polyangiales bacterium]
MEPQLSYHHPREIGAATEVRAVRDVSPLFDALAWLVLGGVLACVLASFRSYGLAWDGQGETVFGTLLLKYYTSFFRDHSAFEFVNFRYYGGGFELPAAILARISPFGQYETRHLFGGLLGLIGLGATWRIARRLGGPRAGALAALLLGLNPGWYGHGLINARDVPFGSGMALCLWLTLQMLDELPEIRWRTRVLFGIALGWTISVRVGGVLALV